MGDTELPVLFRPPGASVHVLEGTRLVEAAGSAGIALDQPCGGRGKCGKCRVVVAEGAAEPTDAERTHLSPAQLQAGMRLACQSSIRQPTLVDIPPTSLGTAEAKILVRSQATRQSAGDPPIQKQYCELPPPDMGDTAPDLARLERVIGPFEACLPILRQAPARFRETGFRGTAVLAGDRLIDIEPGNTEADNLAVAVDLGTTTLVAALVDVNSGEERAVVARMNPQTRAGDDVLSRIQQVREVPAKLTDLHQMVVAAVDQMIGELVDQAGVARRQIYQVTFSGNTTMQQLLAAIDPRPLGEIPFVPATGHGYATRAADLGLALHPEAIAHVSPVIGGFVGGDTVSGILAMGLAEAAGPTLLVDIGTNGEIALSANERLLASSTAAGPAFEGARIAHGMRGTTGAIEKVAVADRLRFNVIGNVAPVGLCGSGLIDLAAELLRHGLLTPEGRLRTPDELPTDLLPDLARRVVVDRGQLAFLLVAENETGHGNPIVLSQRDVRELQLAAGAIRAGIAVLLRLAEVNEEDLRAVWIAGGFGNFIRRNNAQQIGLLPPRVEHRRIRYCGNTSLAGARMTALSRQARAEAEDLARRTEHVNLSRQPGFLEAFTEAMRFPDL